MSEECALVYVGIKHGLKVNEEEATRIYAKLKEVKKKNGKP